jgi:hypothetical protein
MCLLDFGCLLTTTRRDEHPPQIEIRDQVRQLILKGPMRVLCWKKRERFARSASWLAVPKLGTGFQLGNVMEE